MTEVPSFEETDRTFGGATGMLVTWCPWPDKGVPCKRAGEHARSWSRWSTSIFMYLSASTDLDQTREIILSPASHPLAKKHFQNEETGGLAQKSIRFSMAHGGVLILRGQESRANWDMTHLPSVPKYEPIDARGDFFLELESVHPLRFLEEKKLRPPVRDSDGVSREMHFTPLFFNYDLKLAPALCEPNEQPANVAPPPPLPPKKAEPAPKKKRKPAKKRAKNGPPPKTQKVDDEDDDEEE